jgi:hypothetical protein
MTTGVDVITPAASRVTRALALVQLAIGALLGISYAVLLGSTLVAVWRDENPQVAFARALVTATAVVAVVVVAFSLLTGWILWRSARGDGTDPGTAMILLILQAVAWGGMALLMAVGFFSRFDGRPVAVGVAGTIAVFSIVSAGWIVSRDRD